MREYDIFLNFFGLSWKQTEMLCETKCFISFGIAYRTEASGVFSGDLFDM